MSERPLRPFYVQDLRAGRDTDTEIKVMAHSGVEAIRLTLGVGAFRTNYLGDIVVRRPAQTKDGVVWRNYLFRTKR